MQEVYEFLKKAGTYYLATSENGQPHVRPFGTVNLFDGKLYIQTGKVKAVSRQMHANPRLELCASVDGRWLRIEASAVEERPIPRCRACTARMTTTPRSGICAKPRQPSIPLPSRRVR